MQDSTLYNEIDDNSVQRWSIYSNIIDFISGWLVETSVWFLGQYRQ
jgi:hypothetical protein